MKTYVPKQGEVKKQWLLVDADGKVLGRVAAEVARLLRGKHKPQFTPYLDCGDPVVVINASKIKVTGGKMDKKVYYRHTGYPGGLKETKLADMMRKDPAEALEKAIVGMLPHNRLGRQLGREFRVYPGADHAQEAQNPQPHEF